MQLLSLFVSLSIALGVTIAEEQHDPPLPPHTNVRVDSETSFILFGTRHGNRNPEQFVDAPDRTWGEEGDLELTSIGKRQAYGLGRAIRAFVGDKINGNYKPSEAKFFSSSASRCQMTLQTALAGIFDPSGFAEWNSKSFNHWSPIPYTIDDPLLRMYSVKGCVNSDKAWDPISKDTLPELEEIKNQTQPILNYIAESDPKRKASISDAADIADNIIQMDFYNATYPKWLSHPTLPGFTRESLRAAILSLTEAHTIKCANYAPCRDLMGGLWLQHILAALEGAAAGKTTKIIGYASHTEVTLSVMKLMGIEKAELTTSAGFLVEFKNTTVGPAIRLLNHDPNPIDEHVIYKSKLAPALARATNAEGWMPLDAFKEFVAAHAIEDWQSSCGISGCAANAAQSSSPLLFPPLLLLLSLPLLPS